MLILKSVEQQPVHGFGISIQLRRISNEVLQVDPRQRTGEVGIRMALGAQTTDVLRLVLADGGRLIGLGVVTGVAGPLLLTRVLEKMLFSITAYDPLTFVVVVVLLVGIASVACLMPARRASKMSPMIALRSE